ncbi:hypothetical protein ACHAPU_010619 [Fusarium lateritium]
MDWSGSDFSEDHELTYEEFQNLTRDYDHRYGDYEYGDPDWETESDGFRDDEPKDNQELPVATLQKSTWFNIPPCLRQDILRLAFGDRIIHLGLEFDMYGALDAEDGEFGGQMPPI